MERTRREESLSFKEKMGRLLADARAGKRQLEYRDIFRYFRWNSFFTLFRKNIR